MAAWSDWKFDLRVKPSWRRLSGRVRRSLAGLVLWSLAGGAALVAVRGEETGEKAALALFEKTVLPTLKDHCYECHSAKADEVKGNFRVDSREALRRGGNNGAAVVPGDVERSFLIKAIRYREDDYKMPPRGKLDDDVLKAFDAWIRAGAPDPRKH